MKRCGLVYLRESVKHRKDYENEAGFLPASGVNN